MSQVILKKPLSSLSRSDFPAGNTILLVTGGASYEDSGAAKYVSSIFSENRCVRYSGFSVNPKLEDVINGLELIRDYEVDLIVTVGGGSPMDMGKLMKAFVSVPEKPFEYISGNRQLPGSGIPLVAIPSTSGSGSESTHFAVVYKNTVKYSLAHSDLLPDTVVLDPSLTASMSPYQTACSGLDALAQAVESYWSRNSTDESRSFARRALELILPNLVDAVNRPDMENRRSMQLGANLAGRAINVSKTTGAHAFCYYLTSHFGVPHGHAAALMLLVFFRYNDDTTAQAGEKRRLESLYSLIGNGDAASSVLTVKSIMESCGLATRLSEVMDIDWEFDGFFDAVNLERLKNNPRPVVDRTVFRSFLD